MKALFKKEQFALWKITCIFWDKLANFTTTNWVYCLRIVIKISTKEKNQTFHSFSEKETEVLFFTSWVRWRSTKENDTLALSNKYSTSGLSSEVQVCIERTRNSLYSYLWKISGVAESFTSTKENRIIKINYAKIKNKSFIMTRPSCWRLSSWKVNIVTSC